MDEVAAIFTLDQVGDALIDGFDTIANEMQGFMIDMIPVAIPVMGIGLIIGIGIKTFKKLTK